MWTLEIKTHDIVVLKFQLSLSCSKRILLLLLYGLLNSKRISVNGLLECSESSWVHTTMSMKRSIGLLLSKHAGRQNNLPNDIVWIHSIDFIGAGTTVTQFYYLKILPIGTLQQQTGYMVVWIVTKKLECRFDKKLQYCTEHFNLDSVWCNKTFFYCMHITSTHCWYAYNR